MARKYSSESSDDYAKDERDRYRPHSGKKSSRSDKHSDHKDNDASDSERRNRNKRDDHHTQKVRIDDKDRERSREEARDRDGRWESRHKERKESESSDEEGEITYKERTREEGQRSRRHFGRDGRREETDGHGVKETHQSSDEDVERRQTHRRERTYERDNGHRLRNSEDRHKIKNRSARHNSEDEIDRKSERDRDRRRRINNDGDNDRNHRDKYVSKQQEESRMKEDGHGRLVEDSKPQRQSTNLEGNLNGETSNLGKSGGVYIPPFKLARMMKEVQDKSSVEYQRLTWDALRKSINGLVNKVNAANIKNIIPELFSENLIRGRGLFCRSCMKSQMASPGFTDVFAALVAVVNTKFPEVGDLLLRRIVLQLKRAYKRNDKVC